MKSSLSFIVKNSYRTLNNICLLFLIILSSYSKLLSQWNISTGGYLTSFYATCFTSANTGYVVGSSGTVIKTVDGGMHWFVLPSPVTDQLNTISFINENCGYAAGDNGIIIKSTNGGNTWIKKTSGSANNINSLYFFDENSGYVAGGKNGQNTLLLKTTNGGDSWVSISLGNPAIEIYSICFTSSSIGFLSGNYNLVYKTTNGGSTWFQAGFTGNTNWLHSLCFLSSTIGFVLGQNSSDLKGQILKTSNGGLSWNIVYTHPLDKKLNSIKFYDNFTGYATGDEGIILKTTDGGSTWNPLNSDITANLNAVFCTDPNTFFVVSGAFIDNSSIYKTTDGGTTFKSQINAPPDNKHLLTVFFPTKAVGYTAGYSGAIFKTTDEGNTWLLKNSGISSSFYFNSIYFFDDLVGLVAGEDSIPSIIKTTNGGESWSTVYSGGSTWQTSMCFADNNTGYSTSYDGIILKTTNKGDIWSPIAIGNNIRLNSSFFIDQYTGFVGGKSTKSIILKTVNGGIDWDTVYIATDEYGLGINSIQFINSVGYAVDYSGPMIKTTDGGITWIQVSLSYPYMFNRISFIDENNGYAIGYPGKIYKTTDGANTWIQQTGGFVSNLNDIFFKDSSTGYAVGYWGTILKTSSGGATDVKEPETNSVPEDFYLSQNYPNPFNPSTKIQYAVSSRQFVTLKVYDVLGREVATLVNEEKEPGIYRVEFNSQDYQLASGIYFYRIQAGQYVETKKMILMK